MDTILGNILYSGSYYYLAGLLAASLMFTMIGFRLIKNDQFEGLVFIAFAIFFFAANMFIMLTDNSNTILTSLKVHSGVLHWIIFILGPAVIMLFFFLGLYNLIKFALSEALMKVFTAVILMGLIFMVGYGWPDLVKAGIIVSSTIFWFKLELQDSSEY